MIVKETGTQRLNWVWEFQSEVERGQRKTSQRYRREKYREAVTAKISI